MAKNSSSGADTSSAPKKNRWYKNLADSYRIVARTYKWVPYAMIILPILLLGGSVALGMVLKPVWMWLITGVMLALLADMLILSTLLRPAMYSQVDGTVGSVYVVISQIKRGWVINDQPVQVTREQDLVWRIVGRAGVVLISEGPSNHVRPLLVNERKKINRITANAPVVFIECGHDEGQIPLKKLPRKLRSLKKQLTKAEVPAVAMRLDAIEAKSSPIPRGVDPNNVRMNRRALRGK
ncbi:DUF4191 domain-containing protein [Scrofimicrobium sp. R131]|uniref:DUF4191 domain-containing protein n=1 Tax=Scrofimicrobium appendicitidis TaxID=3079930 RepID=A0AAU7V9D3_9ACTO